MFKVITRFAVWAHNRSVNIKMSWRISSTILLFLIGAALEHEIQRVFDEDPSSRFLGIAWWFAIIVVAIFLGFIYRAYLEILESEAKIRDTQIRTFQRAREQLVALNHRSLIRCDEFNVQSSPVTAESLREILICSQSRIQQLIESLWEVVDSAHNISALETERVNFEVTLITKSRMDGYLTIAAWKNRDMLSPRSLEKRRQEKYCAIYDETVAARLIQNGSPRTKVIPDTSAPEENYNQLYEDQKTRIRSSVVHLVLSPSNQALGALVLHCEHPNFFRKEDHRYWQEFFSIFAPFVGLELERIDAYNRAVAGWPASVEEYHPF